MALREPAFEDGDRGLQQGYEGAGVVRVNHFLQLRGYLPADEFDFDPIDHFSAKTTLALRLYQTDRGLPATGIVDDATFATFTCRRCGRPNAPTFALNHTVEVETLPDPGNPWKSNHITYRLTRPSNRADLTIERIEAALEDAFHIWHEALPVLEFEKKSSGVAMIEIRFYGREAHDGEEGADSAFQLVTADNNAILAHAFYPLQEDLGKRAGDIHVNDLVDWAEPKPDYDLVTVLAHEIGHALGFSHSNSRTSLMYPEHTQSHTTLPAEDKTLLENVYVHNYQLVITSIKDGKSGGKNPVGITAKAPD